MPLPIPPAFGFRIVTSAPVTFRLPTTYSYGWMKPLQVSYYGEFALPVTSVVDADGAVLSVPDNWYEITLNGTWTFWYGEPTPGDFDGLPIDTAWLQLGMPNGDDSASVVSVTFLLLNYGAEEADEYPPTDPFAGVNDEGNWRLNASGATTGFTFDSTMPQLVETTVEFSAEVEQETLYFYEQAGGVIQFTDAQLSSVTEFVEDAVTLSEATEDFSMQVVADTFAFTDARVEVREHYVADALRLSDAQRQAGGTFSEDTISFTDASVGTSAHAVVDVLSFTDQREAATVSTRNVQDSITFSDAATSITVDLVESSLTFSDAQRHVVVQVVADEITLSDQLDDGSALTSELVSTFTLSDAVEIQRVGQHDVVEHITFTDEHFHKDPGAIAWVMNTETAAPSWYSNWQFIDMVQVGDQVLAVGPEGLVELGAGTDEGEEIDASVGYGFLEMGGYDRNNNPVPDPVKKRVDAFWFGYTSDDVLEVSVETRGQPVYTYSMQARTADEVRNNRVRPGKGLNARYWRVGIQNTGGGAFDVKSVGADVLPTTRRL